MGMGREVVRGLELIMGMVKALTARYREAFNPLSPTCAQNMQVLTAGRFHMPGEDKPLGPKECFQTLADFFANPYFQRVWVLQEAVCNAESTLIHLTHRQFPWEYLLFADSCYRQRVKFRCDYHEVKLSLTWTSLLFKRLVQAGKVEARAERYRGGDNLMCLNHLFQFVFEEFESSDPRDKLFALIDFARETQRGTAARRSLAPDYGKSVSQVFIEFTHWCVRHFGRLEILSLVSAGPRRILPDDWAKFGAGDALPKSCLDLTSYPSWAVWPEKGGFWAQGRVRIRTELDPKGFDLAGEKAPRFFDLVSHPTIKVPESLLDRFLGLGGRRIGVVKSVMRLRLKSYKLNKEEAASEREIPTNTAKTLQVTEGFHTHYLTLAHPYRDMLLKGGIETLWATIRTDWSPAVVLDGDESMEISPSQEWLGRAGGKYKGNEEIMFRDFLETLLMSPIHRGNGSFHQRGDDVPPGPWNDCQLTVSLILFWTLNDPELSCIPQRIAEYLKKKKLSHQRLPQSQHLPFPCNGVGKCFFITEDERMGLCPPDTRPGDIIVAFDGGPVPFVLRPVTSEANFEGNDWEFEGCEELKDHLFRLIGECYLHGCMSEAFMRDQEANIGEPEVYHLW